MGNTCCTGATTEPRSPKARRNTDSSRRSYQNGRIKQKNHPIDESVSVSVSNEEGSQVGLIGEGTRQEKKRLNESNGILIDTQKNPSTNANVVPPQPNIYSQSQLRGLEGPNSDGPAGGLALPPGNDEDRPKKDVRSRTSQLVTNREVGLTITLTKPEHDEMESDPGDTDEDDTSSDSDSSSDGPSGKGGRSRKNSKKRKKQGKSKKKDDERATIERYSGSKDVPAPEWLTNDDNFYESLANFISRCNSSVKTAIWKKCFTRRGDVLASIKTVKDLKKLISAMVIVFLKYQDKSRPLVKEREVSPHVSGAAQYLQDTWRQIVQKDFVNSKTYFSSMLKEYHKLIQSAGQDGSGSD